MDAGNIDVADKGKAISASPQHEDHANKNQKVFHERFRCDEQSLITQ